MGLNEGQDLYKTPQ